MLSLVPSAWAENEGDAEPYGAEDTSAVESKDGLSGPCGATEDDTVAWALTENNDSLYCVTKTTDDTTSWRFYENTADVEEGQSEIVQAYTLTISGEGAMADYARNTTPWGLKLAELLNKETTGNNVSDFCSPHITRVVFTEDSNVTYIGAHAFRSTSIRTFEFPASVVSIGDYAFIMCRQLKSITAAGDNANREFYVDDDVVYQPYDGGLALRFFPLAKWTDEYEIEDGVTALGSNSMQMAEFTSVTIPTSVRSINSYAFNSTALTSVTFADGCEPSFGTEFEDNELSPGAGAFSNCKNLTTINFPQNVTELPNSLFSGDVSLTEFDIPDSVTEIGNSAFANTGITEIEIPAGVTTIGSGVFSTSAPAEGEKPVRTSIAVNFKKGSNLTSIGSACFDGLSYKATFDAEDTVASKVFSQAGYQISFYGQTLPEDENLVYGWADASSLMVVGLTEKGEKASSIAIPATATAGDDETYPVVGIGDSVFAGTAGDGAYANTTLESVKLGANIEFIGGRAFRYCTGLTTVDFSEAIKLERIGNNAFYDAKSVTAWDLSACTALTTVEDSAFLYGFGKTTTLRLPGNIESWGTDVISSAPVKVYVDVTSTTFTTLVSVLDKKSDTFTFGGETDVYKNLAYETQYKNGEYTVTITGFASGATEKDEVAIPDEIKGMKVTAVAEKAFSDAYKQIKRVTIGKNVSQIGNYAFASSRGSIDGTLESVTFNEGVPVSVGTRAFQKYRNNFTTFDAGNRELTLGDNVFLGSSALTLINIPNVKSLGKGVFHGYENTAGTLIINGEAGCDPLTFKDYTSGDGTAAADSLKKATIYAVGDANKVKSEVEALGSIGSNILCLTNGGTLKNPPTSNIELATPVKDGYIFDGWYDNADFSGNAVITPTAGKVYYAKWMMANAISLTADNTSVDYGTPITLTVAPTNSSWGYVWYKDANGDGILDRSTDTSINNNGNVLVLNNVSESGTYWAVVLDDNSTRTSNSVSVTINKANGTASVRLESWAYGETAKTPVPTSATNDTDNVTYLYKAKDANDSTYSKEVPTAAGSYTVKATFPETENYNAVTAMADFTITKATYNMTDVKFEDASYTYDGNEKTLTISGTLPTGVTVAYENNKLTNAGSVTATAKFTIEDSNNYCAIDDMTATLTITKAKPTVSISAKPDSLRGGGKVTLTVTGVPEEGNVIVTCDNGITVDNANGTYSAVLPNRTVDYTFTLNYTGVENGNYSDATDTCTVSVTRRSSGGGSSSSDRSYAVTAPSTKNGDVTVSPKNASKGDRVTITVTPDKGYELDKLTVKDVSGNKLKLTDKGNGKYTFTMPGSKVTVSAEFVEEQAASIFADVPADAYYAKAVEWAVKKGITNGKANGLFGSNDPCTRGQIVTFLWRAAGSPAPKGTAKVPGDVLPGSYCYDAVAWALENGITNGLADGTFGVNNTCTRGQSVTFLFRAIGKLVDSKAEFGDVLTDSYYANAVAWAVENGVTNGIGDGLFGPDNSCTRAQIVTFLYRAYQGK